MGSLARKLKREQAKREYQKFSAEWRAEKARRAEATKAGSKEENDRPLAHRPTFKQWTGAVSERARAIEAAIKAAVSKEKLAEDVKDLEWEDDDKKEAKETAPVG